ncbi:MAG: TonB family protein [Deltaproteobacteria bacterium]|nr:TonB family protein [Deltaproteobacteria bacterium]
MDTKTPLTFRIYRGDQLVREESLAQDIIKIGKLESSHLRIDDDNMSRMHAVIEVTGPGEIHVIDLGSARGTIVNGQKVNKCQIQDGDELLLGDTRIVVGVGAGAAASAAVPSAPASRPMAPSPAPIPPPVMAAPMMQPPMPGVMPPPSPSPAPVFAPPVAPPMMAPQPAPMQAYVPAMDPMLDVQDGSRAIEVTAMFEDSVLEVKHLSNPAAGKVSPVTWATIILGAATFLGGLVLALVVTKLIGVGALLMILGVAKATYGLTRLHSERESPDYVVGESVEANIHVRSPSIPAPAFPLVRSSGVDYSLLFTGQMAGDVTVGADRIALDQLPGTGRAAPAGDFPGTYSFQIPQNARIKIDLGDNTFLINSVAPARRVVAPFLSTVNWAAQMSNGVSFAAHAIFLFLIFSIPPDAKSLSLDLFNADNKFVKFLIKPPEQKEDEIPDWLKKKGPDEAGGKGQKHKGDEGKMGKKDSQKKTGLYGLKGPKDNADPHLAKRLAEDAAQNAGVLGLLKQSQGSHLASIFGRDTALGTDAEDALGGLIGNQVGEAYGVGGLGLVGSGRGGGGTGEGTIGLGTLGTIGKGGGGGDGAGYGRGVGRLGGRRAKAPRVLAGQAEVRGSLDKEIIRRIIRRHINEVSFCYSKELQSKPDLSGRVMIQFTISATGQVVASVVQSSTMNNQVVDQCIAQAVRRWLFPKPKGGGIVIVSYPFVLRAAGAE